MSTRVRSFSKINLGLAVGPLRPDGFHPLTTVYQTLALHDWVTVSAEPAPHTTLRLTANHTGVPTDARNTAWKIVAGALERLGITAEVTLTIDKRLPVQGGMGAGSANAAAALLGLEHELARLGTAPLPGPVRLQLAAEVGSDVPLFLLGGTVLGLGRGEEVYPLPDGGPLPCVIAVPEVGVSTALAFQQLDARHAAQSPAQSEAQSAAQSEAQPGAQPAALTSAAAVDKLKELSYAIAAAWSPSGNLFGAPAGPSGITRANGINSPSAQRGDLAENPEPLSHGPKHSLDPLLALVRTGIENDFEEVAFSQHPSLRSIKRDLLGSSGDGALGACLSGSGSALFGLYQSQAAAAAAQQRVRQSGTRAILTETLPRREYWRTLFA